MAQNKIVNFEPVVLSATGSVYNLVNCDIASLTGPIGYTQTQPYLIIKHIRLNNRVGAAVTASLFKGASNASAAGTEFAFPAALSIPANSYYDWYGQARFDSTDYLTGVAGSATSIVANIDGEIGLA